MNRNKKITVMDIVVLWALKVKLKTSKPKSKTKRSYLHDNEGNMQNLVLTIQYVSDLSKIKFGPLLL